MDKGALHVKLAHIETETDKVTQSRVALTERERESTCICHHTSVLSSSLCFFALLLLVLMVFIVSN